ncbi:hypothetical protein, partial [Streptomyces sp. IB201691-2A2]|uniref:hypothetical protein n=1 Tax=Streptomyces sp. IB201691-2A2 TaxID=2561920 RepID=UPI00117D205A
MDLELHLDRLDAINRIYGAVEEAYQTRPFIIDELAAHADNRHGDLQLEILQEMMDCKVFEQAGPDLGSWTQFRCNVEQLERYRQQAEARIRAGSGVGPRSLNDPPRALRESAEG